MSQWDSYPNSVQAMYTDGHCIGSGIYGLDGNTYAITPGMPAFTPADMKRMFDYVRNKDYTKGIGLNVGSMSFTYLRTIEDTETYVFKRKSKRNDAGDEVEKLDEESKYQLFVQLAKSTAMVGIFKGGSQGKHDAGLKRINELVAYLISVNM